MINQRTSPVKAMALGGGVANGAGNCSSQTGTEVAALALNSSVATPDN